MWAVVTGSTGGIGTAVVARLADLGVRSYAVGRNLKALDALASTYGALPVLVDLTDHHEIHARLSPLEAEVVVNAAGTGLGMDSLVGADPDAIRYLMQVNAEAPLHVTRAMLPGMLRRGRGQVINIGSIAGLYPTTSSTYSASKAAVHGFTCSLRNELAGSVIRVTEICPGRVNTAFFETAFGRERGTAELGQLQEPLPPETVAEAVAFCVSQPTSVNVSLLEVMPVEQTIGGPRFKNLEDS